MLVSFSREFNVLTRFFVAGITWSVRVSSGKTLLRDVTGKALLCSAVIEFVAP